MKKYFLPLVTIIVLVSFFCSPAFARRKRQRSPKWYEFWEKHEEYEEYEEYHKHPKDDEHTKFRSRKSIKYHDRRFYGERRIVSDEAKQIVLESFSRWRIGKGWERKKRGLGQIIVPLEYYGKIIGEVKIDSITGEILPERARSFKRQRKISLLQAGNIVRVSLSKMVIGNKIRLGKHGNFWEVPLLFRGVEVEEIKVGSGTGKILPDWHIEEEAYSHRRHRRSHEDPDGHGKHNDYDGYKYHDD